MLPTQIIVLAAGEGKRMGGKLPKVLMPLKGKPIIAYLLDSIKISGVCEKPLIVIGDGRDRIKTTLGPDYEYVVQEKQQGTGHAVSVCKDFLKGKAENIIVLYGDQPFVSLEVLNNLQDLHTSSNATMTLMTVNVLDFEDWREPFYSYGRIVRDANGDIHSIVEEKDCTEDQKKIKELNTAFFCFKSDWLWKNTGKLKNNNVQKEYYLTDLLGMAIQNNEKISSIPIDPKVAIGINTPEQLKMAESLLRQKIQ